MIENICNTSFIIVAHLNSDALIRKCVETTLIEILLHSYLSIYEKQLLWLYVGIEVA